MLVWLIRNSFQFSLFQRLNLFTTEFDSIPVMSEENNEAFANFMAITGATEDRAKFFMESSNWNLDVSDISFNEGIYSLSF